MKWKKKDSLSWFLLEKSFFSLKCFYVERQVYKMENGWKRSTMLPTYVQDVYMYTTPLEMTAPSSISLRKATSTLCVHERALCKFNEMKEEFYWLTMPLLLATPWIMLGERQWEALHWGLPVISKTYHDGIIINGTNRLRNFWRRAWKWSNSFLGHDARWDTPKHWHNVKNLADKVGDLTRQR